MNNLNEQVAIVTGGTLGVGRGIASALADSGARVFVTGRSVHDGVPNGERITGIRCDHRMDSEVTAAFERVARETHGIDILVNNVWGGYERMVENGAFTWVKPFWEQPLWRWDAMFNAGVRAHYHALTNSESPEFIGRAVAALGGDPDVMRHTGTVLVAASLALEYGFTDIDGKVPRPLTLADV